MNIPILLLSSSFLSGTMTGDPYRRQSSGPPLPDGVDNENWVRMTYPTLRCISLSKNGVGTKTTTVLLLHEMHRLTKDTPTVYPSRIGLKMRDSIGHTAVVGHHRRSNETGHIRTANRLGGFPLAAATSDNISTSYVILGTILY